MTKIDITPSSGNVFQDLDLPNPEKLLFKAKFKLHCYNLISAIDRDDFEGAANIVEELTFLVLKSLKR